MSVAIATAKALNSKPSQRNGGLEPCCSCRYYVRVNELARCHLNPPQIRVPYDNMSAWPVVPDRGGGCGQWKEIQT